MYIRLQDFLIPSAIISTLTFFCLRLAPVVQVDEDQIIEMFITEDREISIQIDATLGDLIGYETRSIQEGIITIKTQGQSQDIPVVGDIGC